MATAVSRRRCPRKKDGSTVMGMSMVGGDASGGGDGAVPHRDGEGNEDGRGVVIKEIRDMDCLDDGEDDLPELATLLGTSGGDRNQGTVVSGARRSKERTPRTGILQTPATAQRSNPAPSHHLETLPPVAAVPPVASSRSSLLLRATPSLRPTDIAYIPTTASTPLETTTTTSSSSLQMQQRRSPAKRAMALPPAKGGIALPHKMTRNVCPESEMSTSKESSRCTTGTKPTNTSLSFAPRDPLLLLTRGLAPECSGDDSDGDGDGNYKEHVLQSEKICTKKSRSIRQERLGLADARRAAKARCAMFVLKEAACKDDHEDDEEDDSDEEEDFTDLSGFIVDDDAEISFHDSETDSGSGRLARKKSPVRKRLGRGVKGDMEEVKGDISEQFRSLSFKDDESKRRVSGSGPDGLTDAIAGMVLADGGREQESRRSKRSEVEVIDLTSSPLQPEIASVFHGDTNDNMPKRSRSPEPTDEPDLARQRQRWSSESESEPELATNEDKAAIHFSPKSPMTPSKDERKRQSGHLSHVDLNVLRGREPDSNSPTAPPQTPPASPSKLRSPSKLNSPSKNFILSPSKRAALIPQSPHRQSIDAFWSSEVINQWNDHYSPAKPPLTVSPTKRWKTWEDDSDSGDESPSESPARRMGRSPQKPATSPTKSVVMAERRSAAAAKKKFDEQKINLARDLLKELDENISNGELARLSQSTGGVKIIWSKNLRSTAGRANWRRTVTKASTDSSNQNIPRRAGDAMVQHYATIELADKVIDNEERLVNTVAHEYCHLANFMVSGVRGQPHGASFKSW